MMHAQALKTSSQIPLPSPPPPPSRSKTTTHHHLLLAPPPPLSTLKYSHRPSRRELAVGGSTLPLLFWMCFQSAHARAAEDDNVPNTNDANTQEEASKKNDCNAKTMTTQAFLDVSIDGQPIGRIVVGLYGDNAPVGAGRFANLVTGKAGISYRRKEFVKIMPNYIQHGGVRSYGVDAELAKNNGADIKADELLSEWEMDNKNCPGEKNVGGSLAIVIRDPSKPPPKLKLVARKGKLEIDEEEVGTDPNGTEFVITTKDSPELDASTLVIGKVLDGMDVVEKISKVKTVQENTSSPYFRVAKLIGDKRSVVAERGFNRPYSKVIITNCGLIG